MTTIPEELSKDAPGQLALIQDFVNTQYGSKRYAHVELTTPEQLRIWLVAHQLLADGIPVTEGDFRRVLRLREALRSFLRANSGFEEPVVQDEILNHLASNAPLIVRFQHDALPALEPDITGLDGVIACLIGIVFTSMIDGSWARLKACRNDRCQKAFYDTSKNRSGSWCSMARCGSRFKASAYRHRHKAQAEE
ncbi:MAG TPA: CGNR zinc finger domain-containing protein [Ktedonobacteraceae bacterium]